jgi:hypothetical protein
MDCSAMVFVDEFSNLSNTFCRFAGLGRPERLSSSTDTRPALKHECHSKTAIQLKKCSPKASQSISRVSVAYLPTSTQNLMQTHCSILPSIADKMKHVDEKAIL